MTILIVDDESIIADGVATLIRNLGIMDCNVVTTYSVPQAISAVDATPPDLVITDIKMPGLDGLYLLKHLSKDFPDTKAIVLSGYDNYEYVRTAFKYHVLDYFLKPIDTDSLINLIVSVVSCYHSDEKINDFDVKFASLFPHYIRKASTYKLANILVYIRCNYQHDISLNSIAEYADLSEAYICRLFKKELGITYLDYINEVRIRNAVFLLLYSPAKSIKEISYDLGYTNERQFFRMFKAATGVTPGQFRVRCCEP